MELFGRLLEDACTEEEDTFLPEAIVNLNLTNDMSLDFDLMGLKDPDEDEFIEINLEDDDFDLDDYGKSWIEELEENLNSKIGDEFDDMEDLDEVEDEDDEEEF